MIAEAGTGWSQFWSHSALSGPVRTGPPRKLRRRSGQTRPSPDPGTNIWKACWGQPLTSSNLVSSAIALTGQYVEGPHRLRWGPSTSSVSVEVWWAPESFAHLIDDPLQHRTRDVRGSSAHACCSPRRPTCDRVHHDIRDPEQKKHGPSSLASSRQATITYTGVGRELLPPVVPGISGPLVLPELPWLPGSRSCSSWCLRRSLTTGSGGPMVEADGRSLRR